MYAIEFQTQIRDGVIEIPVEKRDRLLPHVPVRVIVLAENQPAKASKSRLEDAREKGYSSFIQYLLDHPVAVDDPTPLTREEIYDRAGF